MLLICPTCQKSSQRRSKYPCRRRPCYFAWVVFDILVGSRPLDVAAPREAQRAKRGGPGSGHIKLLFLRNLLALSKCRFNEYQQKCQQSCRGEEERSAGMQSSAALWPCITSEAGSIAISRESIFLKSGRHEQLDCRCHGALLRQSRISALISSEAPDRLGSHPIRSGAGAVPETLQGRQRKTTSSCRT